MLRNEQHCSPTWVEMVDGGEGEEGREGGREGGREKGREGGRKEGREGGMRGMRGEWRKEASI